MRLPDLRDRRRERSHRILFGVLVGLLAAFSIWCLWLLWQAERLHDEVEFHFAWIAHLRAINDATAPTVPELVDLQARLDDFGPAADPALLIAARRLRSALGDLENELNEPAASEDGVWRASVTALDAAAKLEAALREHLEQLIRRLGGLRRSFYFLIFGSLALGGSNLGFLVLAHHRRHELEAAHAEAVARASHDPLTGLWNREAILRRLEHELVRARRSRSPLGAILVDLDRFAEVNALLGQSEGDDVLRQVGELLGSLVRPYDTLGRFGGDSFLMVLPACDALATTRVAERLRRAIEEHEFPLALGRLELHSSLAQTTVREAEDADVDTVLRELQDRLEDARKVGPGAG